MPYPEAVLKLSIGGNTASEDIWSNGLTITPLVAGGAGTLFNALQPSMFVPAINAFYSQGANSSNTYNTTETVKLALVGTDGKYLADAKIYDYPTPVPGAGSYAVSPQDTVVLSLLTDTKRGLARRGRIYLPAGFAAPAATTGRLSAGDVTAIATKGRTFINAINTVLRADGRQGAIVIASKERQGAIRLVTGVEVGNLMDNQSRRRNRLQEVYTTLPLVTSV